MVRRGWNYLADTRNGPFAGAEAVGYGITYDAVPTVLATAAGYSLSAPSSLSSCTGTSAYWNPNYEMGDHVYGVISSSFNYALYATLPDNGGSAGYGYWCYSWTAIGPYAAGADLAEYYRSTEELEAGDIVAIDQNEDIRIHKSQNAYDKTSIGIVSTDPGQVLGNEDGKSAQEDAYPIALAGRVPVKVSLEGGPIARGDALTTSSIPGVAMKATKPGPIVGKAMEAYTGDQTIIGTATTPEEVAQMLSEAENTDASAQGYGKIMVYVNTSYYDPRYEEYDPNFDEVKITNKEAGTYAMNEEGELIGLGAYANTLSTSTATTVNETDRQNLVSYLQGFGNTATDTLSAATANVYGKMTAFEIDVTTLKVGGVSIDDYVRNLIAQSGNTATQPITMNSTDSFSANNLTTQQLEVKDSTNQVVSKLDQQGNANFLGTVTSQKNIAAQMDAQYLTTQELNAANAQVTGELTANSARIAALEAQNATVSGTLYADRIEANLETRQISDFEQRVRDIVASERASMTESSPSALLADAATLDALNELNGISTTTESDEFGTLTDTTSSTATSSGTLQLIGDGSLTQVDGDLNITGLLAADLATFNTSLSVKETFIGESFLSFNTQTECGDNLICNTFSIQPSGEGKLSLMADSLVITKDGGVAVNTDLTVNGKILANGGVETNSIKALNGNDLEINLAKTATESAALATTQPTELIIRGDADQEVAAFTASGSARFRQVVIASDNTTEEVGFDGVSTTVRSNATTGTATLEANKLKLIINNPLVTDNTLIYVTPQGSTGNQVLYVAQKVADNPATTDNEASFTVAVDTAVSSDITFTYWLVEAQASL